MSKEAMKLAIDWFKCNKDGSMSRNNAEALADEVVEALEEALAKQEGQSNFCPQCEALARELKAVKQEQGEPVGQLLEDAFGRGQVMWFNKPEDESMLYTTPQQRTWVGLTDEEIKEIHNLSIGQNIGFATGLTEAKLKETNG